MDPTKKVTASAAAPTACTYAGTAPRAKQEAPTMNSQAIAELRRTGSTSTLRPSACACQHAALRAACQHAKAYGLRLSATLRLRLAFSQSSRTVTASSV